MGINYLSPENRNCNNSHELQLAALKPQRQHKTIYQKATPTCTFYIRSVAFKLFGCLILVLGRYKSTGHLVLGRVLGQNGSGQSGTDKMVWTKWYTDKMVLDKMVWIKWHGQNGTILYFVYILIQLNSIYI